MTTLSERRGVVPDPDDLDVAVGRLLDSGRLMAPRPRPTSSNPNPQRVLIMANLPRGFPQSGDPFGDIDEVAARRRIEDYRRTGQSLRGPTAGLTAGCPGATLSGDISPD
jgi:hypothetical protein